MIIPASPPTVGRTILPAPSSTTPDAPEFGAVYSPGLAFNTEATIYTTPAGVTAGDLEVILHYSSSDTSTAPDGWDEIPGIDWPVNGTAGGDTSYVYGWQKIAGGDEPDSYTVTESSSQTTDGIIFTTTGNQATTPITAASADNGTGTETTWLSLTTTAANEMIVAFQIDWDTTSNPYTPPAGDTPTFTSRYNTAPILLATGVVASSGTATGDKTTTNNNTAGQPWTSVMLAIQP